MATSAGNLKSATQVLGRIAGYELLEQVGRGGMGVVFRARDPNLDKIVAIKILPDERARDAEYRARFLREARTEASIDHPLIACCFSIGEADLDPPHLIPSETQEPPLPRKLYLTMEFIPGSDLSALVNGEPLAIERVLDLTGQIAEGLEVAHAAGVVHRDIKPANVRVTRDGRVKLLDFGLAAIIPKPNSKTDSFKSSIDRKMGTCHFMSPEQTHGRTIDPRTDLFSLGVVLYLLVTGRLPFTGETPYEVEEAIRHTEPPPMARYANGVSAELERITKKLLAKDASNRYQSAHEVHTDLELLRRAPSPKPDPPKPPVPWTLLAALAAVLVLIAAWLAYLYWRPWRAVAVVPFTNSTGDPRLDYLGNGVAAGVVTSLIRNSNLSVTAMSTVQQVPPEKRDARRLKHELGVDATLAGSLSRHDGVLHLDLELVEGKRGFVIWAEGYNYDLAASEDVERQIAHDLVRRVSIPNGGREAPAPRPTKPPVASAKDLVLRAAAALDDPDDANGPERALGQLAKALDQDPDFALAWAWRSRALWKLWDRDRSKESLDLAEEAANRAVRLNPDLLDGRLALAQVYRARSHYPDAIRELNEVLRVNPNLDEAELQLAAAYRDAGALAQAESHIRHATDVRPGYWRNWNSLGYVLFLRGNYAGAREAYGRVIHLVPEKNEGYTRLATVETKTGQYAAAIALYDQLPAPVQDGPTASNMGTAYFFTHRLQEARRYFALAARLTPGNAALWINLGDLETKSAQPDSARRRYVTALELVDEQLQVNPKNIQLRVQGALCLAKLGRCAEANTALAVVSDSLVADNVELTHQLAKAYALCDRRADALAAARRAVALGMLPATLRDEDEFAALARDPAFPTSPAHKTP